MMAVTLPQPAASLVASGVQTIHTTDRRAPDNLIGQRMAIHAADETPSIALVNDGTLHAVLRLFPERSFQSIVDAGLLPVGRVVGSAVLAACVPIVDRWPNSEDGVPCVYAGGKWPASIVVSGAGSECWGMQGPIADQLPFGDFAPGRWAWLLTDAAPTTTRCPWCWGDGMDLDASARTLELHCPACDGVGYCPPVVTIGGQGVWERAS